MTRREPRVSIVTVTKDRPEFIEHLRHNISALDYDTDLIEWIVVDDSREPILDSLAGVSGLVYCYSEKAIPLGRKRNLANSLTKGDIIFNFDDDNYAFPSRIKVAVEFFAEHPDVLIVGSSEMFILDVEIGQIYVVGPFTRSHATLGTWAFRRCLLGATAFVDTDSSREEAGFTKGWTIPIGQLDKRGTSICVDHGRNTVSKKHLLKEATARFSLEEVIEDDFSRRYFEKLIRERRSTV
jgi:glycosyltransferase involved in cell wall biosynthesis